MLKVKHPKKPEICTWISNATWSSLKLAQKDFIIYVYQRKYTKLQIARKLRIETNSWYWRFINKIQKALKWDIDKINQKL